MTLDPMSASPSSTETGPVLTCLVVQGQAAVVLHVSGELDSATAPVLTRAVTGQVALGYLDVRVHLQELTFCDVRGLRALHRVHQCVSAAGGHLTFFHPRQFVQRIADLCGMHCLFESVV